MAQIIVAEVTAYDPSIPGTRVLYFATQGYVSKPTDSPANTYYDGRIQQPASVLRTMFAPNQTTGRSQIGYGNLVLTNADGGLDALLDYSFAGRPIVIKLGEVLASQLDAVGATFFSGAAPTWTTVITGTMEQVEFNWRTVVIRVRDRQQDIAKPLQSVRYAGNNALPNGLEGVAGDIAGKSKPLVFGQVFNAPITLVNSTRLIYQAHDGSALQAVNAVYDRGVALTAGAAYASQADMEANAPAANQYRVWNAAGGCYIRLGGNPTGTVTADLTQGATAADRSVGNVWQALLLKAGVAAGDISSSDVSALNAACAYSVGLFCSTMRDISALEACDMVAQSIGAWFGTDTAGKFRIGQLVLPSSGTSIGTLTGVEVLSVERVPSRDPGVGVPAFRVKIAYAPVWETQVDLNVGVNADRKAFLANEYRRAQDTDATVQTANLTSPEVEFKTLLVNQADAQAEATRRLTIYKARRDMLTVRVRVDPVLVGSLDLGKIVTLQLNRYGLSAGKKFLVIGIQTDMRNRIYTLTLWG